MDDVVGSDERRAMDLMGLLQKDLKEKFVLRLECIVGRAVGGPEVVNDDVRVGFVRSGYVLVSTCPS